MSPFRHARGGRSLALALFLAAGPLTAACDSPADLPEEVPVGTEIGYRAPPLRGSLSDGGNFNLADSDGLVVLVFYRSADCGLCRLQLDNAQRHLEGYQYEDARLIGVTLDFPEVSRGLVESAGISFPLVSVDPVYFEAWGALPAPTGAPLPATYIVDDGIVRFRHIGRNAADRTTDAGVLTVIESLED